MHIRPARAIGGGQRGPQQNNALADVGVRHRDSRRIRLGVGYDTADAEHQHQSCKPGRGDKEDEHLRVPPRLGLCSTSGGLFLHRRGSGAP